jgi:hypothetical protein
VWHGFLCGPLRRPAARLLAGAGVMEATRTTG